ncbi:S1 family peptidase [Labilithrix luteola]|uniref:S1 family peptidase n=1 Tax=Labilithrix luteola TaxID=1391654 RepID=UPI0011BAD6BB|nr:S1 family peptidase [Labilithrix luteola]
MNAPRRFFLTAAAVSSLLAGVACSSAPQTESLGQQSSPIIKGTNSDASQDAVVLIIHYDPAAGSFGACTGTLLAPKLVLTARHCVADTDEYAACDGDGTPLAAGVVKKNNKPETMYIFTGPNRPDFSRGDVSPAGRGAKIIDDGGKNLCNHDIALIVLKEPITDVPIAPVRLDDEVTVGEVVTSIGWGVTEKTIEPSVRQQRSGVGVVAVGPDKNGRPPVPPNEFEVGESICSGDSGGPAVAESGAVIGIVSRGGNSEPPDQNNPAKNCVDGLNLYTKLSPFKDVILGAYEAAEAEPWLEGQPDPRKATAGTACTDASECRSNLCLSDPDQGGATTCAQDCAEVECPEGQVCTAEGDVKVCRLPPGSRTKTVTTTSGCSAAPASHGNASRCGLLLAVAAFGLAFVRRRRV